MREHQDAAADTQIVREVDGPSPSSPKKSMALCPAGTKLTGGGYETSILSSDLVLRESGPVEIGTRQGWSVNVIEDGLSANLSWSLTAEAICTA